MAADNKMLGQFDLVGIPPAPRGVPQVEVTFDIDANGLVNVGAKDKATNKEQSIRIQASGGLTEADIKKMTEEAERFKDDDKKKKDLVESRNQAEAFIHSTEKSVKDLGDKVAAADKTAIEAAIKALRDVTGGEDVEAIKEKTSALAQASMKIGEAMYANQPGADDPAAGAKADAKGGKDDHVVDADFEEVKDDKKKKG
jgi:molecular chaperone DnaK